MKSRGNAAVTGKNVFPGGRHPDAHLTDEDRKDRDRMAGEGPQAHVRPPDPKKKVLKK